MAREKVKFAFPKQLLPLSPLLLHRRAPAGQDFLREILCRLDNSLLAAASFEAGLLLYTYSVLI